jgi:hypothetical protein
VLLAGVGGRVYFVAGDNSPDAAASASIAQHAAAVQLRASDLPAGWRAVPANQDGAAGTRRTDDPVDRAVARCSGASDPATSVALAATGPSFTSGPVRAASAVSVVRTRAQGQQDLRAQRTSKAIDCLTRLGTPSVRAGMASTGVTTTGLSISRLPGAPTDGFALRMRANATALGRPVTIYLDTYGFVRGKAEVSLTMVSATPDSKLAARLLGALRQRAVHEFPVAD